MTKKKVETKVVFVSRFMQTGTAVFNGNAFPDELNTESTVCANRLSIFLYSVEDVNHSLKVTLSDFQKQLLSQSKDLCSASSKRADLHLVAYSDGLEYLTAFHLALYSLKSFLDVYARLICKLINNKTTSTTFGAKKNKGVKVSGEKLAKWISSSPDSFTEKEQLVEVVRSHGSTWITEAVNYRDTLAHYRDIDGMIDMRLELDKLSNTNSLQKIENPILPNGQNLNQFLQTTLDNLGSFLDETMALLPNVDQKLLSTWENAIKYAKIFEEHKN